MQSFWGTACSAVLTDHGMMFYRPGIIQAGRPMLPRPVRVHSAGFSCCLYLHAFSATLAALSAWSDKTKGAGRDNVPPHNQASLSTALYPTMRRTADKPAKAAPRSTSVIPESGTGIPDASKSKLVVLFFA